MLIKSARTLEEQKDVLMDPASSGPEFVYWVLNDLEHDKWVNCTLLTPGLYGREFAKTYGHYHTTTTHTETYKVVSGQGIFLLQKKHEQDGKLIPTAVEDVVLVAAQEGDEITIDYRWGHSWSNVGKSLLVTLDNYNWGHSPIDYTPIKQMHGLAFYLANNNNKPDLIPNPNYKDIPAPKFMSPQEFINYTRPTG